jgi:hypothetical protein
MSAHDGQKYGRGFIRDRRCLVSRWYWLPLHHAIEQRWLFRLDGRYVRHAFMPGNIGNGRNVWRNGHQVRWYYRWAMGGSEWSVPPQPPRKRTLPVTFLEPVDAAAWRLAA